MAEKTFSRVEWDKLGERLYETGVDHVVLYQLVDHDYTNGVAWNGVTSVTENKSGAEASPLYADNIKYLVLHSLEEYGITVECYTYPDEFAQNNGMLELASGVSIGQQARAVCGVSFRTLIGNDVQNERYGYKLHLVYNCSASPSEESNATISDSPEAKTMSYEMTCTPVTMRDGATTACVTIDSTKTDKALLAALEDILYGGEGVAARMPQPDEIKSLFESKVAPARVTATPGTEVKYGAAISTLQKDIQISGTKVSGQLLYQASAPSGSGFGDDVHHFLTMDLSTYGEGSKVTVELSDALHTTGKVDVTDGFIMFGMQSGKDQSFTVEATSGGEKTSKTYTTVGLTKEAQ